MLKQGAVKSVGHLRKRRFSNLPYRRLYLLNISKNKRAQIIREPADCKSAIRQIANLRYDPSLVGPLLIAPLKPGLLTLLRAIRQFAVS
jgi:hypothetical protein